MAKRPIHDRPEPARLAVPRAQVEAELAKRIEHGKELIRRAIHSETQLEAARSEYYTWSDYNTELLSRYFDNRSLADEYSRSIGIAFGGRPEPLDAQVREFRDDVQMKVRRLESVMSRLELIPEAAAGPFPPRPSRPTNPSQTINIHGGNVTIAQTGLGSR
jgi:hypothetical protein